MCANYVPVTRTERLLTFFGVERTGAELPEAEVLPMGLAPIIRRVRRDEIDPTRERPILDTAIFRFVPEFVTAQGWARQTYNARSEDVAGKRTYGGAWQAGQRCIIPVECFFEPRYFGTVENPGKSERWAVQQLGGVPMGIAGIYRTYTHPASGEIVFAMAMLTVNADGHPVTGVFHRPGDEKRMPVILDPADYDRWLACTPREAQAMCRPWSGALESFAAPRKPRRASPGEGGPQQGGLF